MASKPAQTKLKQIRVPKYEEAAVETEQVQGAPNSEFDLQLTDETVKHEETMEKLCSGFPLTLKMSHSLTRQQSSGQMPVLARHQLTQPLAGQTKATLVECAMRLARIQSQSKLLVLSEEEQNNMFVMTTPKMYTTTDAMQLPSNATIHDENRPAREALVNAL